MGCLPDHGHRQPEKFGAQAAGGGVDALGYPYCHGRLFDCMEADHGQFDLPADRDVAAGQQRNLMVRTELYLRLGGLDGHSSHPWRR